MPRVPDSELQRLKDEISVERLVEAAGVALKRAGRDLLGRCPFHEDDTASLVVTHWVDDPRPDGDSSNGSDEREMARAYYDRVGYPWWNKPLR